MDLVKIYTELYQIYGPQGWWPIIQDTDGAVEPVYGVSYQSLETYRSSWRDPYFEVALGAILTQNTAWANAARALRNLYQAQALTPSALLNLSTLQLELLVRPAGYFRQKTRAIQALSTWVTTYWGGDIRRARKQPLPVTRAALFQIWGVGPETADDILLYALNKPIFVIDTYTKRLCQLHGVTYKTYEEYRLFFEQELQAHKKNFSGQLASGYQEFHALIVAWGKNALIPS